MSNCIIALSSVTYAMKGAMLLKSQGIYAKPVRLEPHQTARGCAYGLQLPCADQRTAKRILQGAQIPVSQIISAKE